MSKRKPCPNCGRVPAIGYACGEYFIVGMVEGCPGCDGFSEMHSSEEVETEAWNRWVDNATAMSKKLSLGQAIEIVKFRLKDPDIALQSKVLAIGKVASMETHNSITKDDLVNSLRWIFEHYELEV